VTLSLIKLFSIVCLFPVKRQITPVDARQPNEVTLQIRLRRQSVRPLVLEDPAEIQRTLEQFTR